jgi:hypothetical protein
MASTTDSYAGEETHYFRWNLEEYGSSGIRQLVRRYLVRNALSDPADLSHADATPLGTGATREKS